MQWKGENATVGGNYNRAKVKKYLKFTQLIQTHPSRIHKFLHKFFFEKINSYISYHDYNLVKKKKSRFID